MQWRMTADEAGNPERPRGGDGGARKALYHTPRLVVHGDFRSLTRGKGTKNNDGGGQGPDTKP